MDLLYIDTNYDTGKMDCETSLFNDSNNASTGSASPCLSPASDPDTTQEHSQANLKSVISRKRSSSPPTYHDVRGGNISRNRTKDSTTPKSTSHGFKRHPPAPYQATIQIHKPRETSTKRKILPLQDLKFDRIPFPNRDREQKFEHFLERLDSFEEAPKAARPPTFHKTLLSPKVSKFQRQQVIPLLDININKFDILQLGTGFDKRNNILDLDKALPSDHNEQLHQCSVRKQYEHTGGRTRHKEPLNGRINSVVNLVAESSRNMHPSCSEYQKIVENLESLICDMVTKNDGVQDFKSRELSKNSFLTKAGMFTDGSERDSRSLSFFVRKLSQMANREENLIWKVLEALEMMFLETRSNRRNLSLTNWPRLKRSSHQFSKEMSDSFCSSHCPASSRKTFSREHSYRCECQDISNCSKNYGSACPEHKRRKY